MLRRAAAAAVVAFAIAGAACGGDDEQAGGATTAGQASGKLTIYSGREEELVAPVFDQFEQQSGITVEVRYGDSAELAATIAEEGDNTLADLFFAQDAGTLGAVAEQGRLAQLPNDLLSRVDERWRDPRGQWVGTSGRARVIAYNTDAVSEDELPDTVFGFTDPRWKGKIGLPPTNASFQAFVTAMRLTEGDDRTREWLEGIKANDPKFYENNSPVLEALAAGEIEVGFVDHHYVYLLKEEQRDAPVANHFLSPGDPGALVNVAGVGVIDGTDDLAAALEFVEFLLSDAGQRLYSERAGEAEYPLVAGLAPREGLPPLESLQGPDVDLEQLGAELDETLRLLSELGYTS